MTKILLIEDNEMNRDMLGRRLQRQGFAVCFAVDGPSGVKMAADETPDLILMDVALGEMDGWEATRLIKSNPGTRQIPIIALDGACPRQRPRHERQSRLRGFRHQAGGSAAAIGKDQGLSGGLVQAKRQSG